MSERLVEKNVVSEADAERFKETCAFLGKSKDMVASNDLKRYSDRCKLSFKQFSLLKRSKICQYCLDPVSSDSIYGKRVPIEKYKKKKATVCVICHAILQNQIPDIDQPVRSCFDDEEKLQ